MGTMEKYQAGGEADQTSGFFTKYSFTWMNPIVSMARKGPVPAESLVLPPQQKAEASYDAFIGNWEASVASGKPNLRSALVKTWGKQLMLAGFFKLVWSICVIMGAFFFVRTLQFHVNGHWQWKADYKGWILAVFFFIDAYILGVALQRMTYGCVTVGISMRAALINCICRKSFGMASITKEMASDAVSFVASDINKIFDGIQDIHYLWTAPIEAAAILTILVILVKEWALPGWGVVFVVMPLQYVFGYFIIKAKKENIANTQERGAYFQELLPAMKLVKYYAWEKFFMGQVSEIRKRELKIQARIDMIKNIQIMMVFATPPITALVIFSAYEMNSGKRLTSTLTFPILSLFNILRFPLVVLPKAMRAASDAMSAIERIQAYLLTEVPERKSMTNAPGVRIRNAQFKHPNSDTFTLNVPEFTVAPGELVAIAGRVGAGKSSLISAILGNMEKKTGEAVSGGRVAYVPQNPWCQNLSLRDSILFGSEMDEDKYASVIHACALELDLEILPEGDDSMAGLRGINLSGGQRQRLNLARAAYAESDLVLLDNALSAVDHHTAHHIFGNCLRGLMRDKAVILITHQVEFLPQCHKVAIMDGGNMIYFGPWNERAREQLSKVLPASHLLAAAGAAEQPRDTTKKGPAKKTAGSLQLGATNITDEASKAKKKKTSQDLTEAMWTYVKRSPLWGTVFILDFIIFLACQTSRQISDWWLRQWSSDAKKWYGPDMNPSNPPGSGPDFPFEDLNASQAYIIVYSIPVLFFFISMYFRGWLFFKWSHGSGQTLLAKAINNVMYAPLGFFLQNPVGELLLAFTKETDIMDETLVDALHYLGIYGLIILSTIITVSTTIYYFSVFAGVLLIVTFIMLAFYLPAATKLKVHRTTTGGALVGLVAETLEGLSVVQAFGKTDYFVETAVSRNDAHNAAVFTGESLNLWLAHWCDLYGAILVLAVSCFAVGMADNLGAATVGLAFSNTIQMLVFYTWSVRFLAETLFAMSSVEKIGWLAEDVAVEGKATHNPKAEDSPNAHDNLGRGHAADMQVVVAPKQNKDVQLDADGAPINWPQQGTVVFHNVWMRYSPTAPFALKGVTYQLNHSDKVGVVGRTGSGKSTMLLALYRVFELDKGGIYVDGVNIASMTLRRLRRGLSIIPQEPVVFSGTVRTNLDPFGEHTDAELWQAIKEADLEGQVKATGGLEGRVVGSGSGAWSLGQQQLVCLARAYLRKVPVLCLDEATAAMDPHTEQQVQAVIKRVFEPRTIITIAHRLDTVIESDKVLVMEAGVLKESAGPSQLLADPESMFSKLVDKTGPQAAGALRQMAADYFARRQAAGHK
uniref:Uncharacterized protein n=1 Tax=Chlamydomonas leiostraca TaxID=1034604 RepID=A0A7S0R9V8_9CHLO|mmetsp:Transcript_17443/g.43900  ORF Transcript_17443/g.43900 Transcript_17443/m.43900 type:complete len:1324 (+) Transcript_17443:147-4118(+)